MTKEEMASALMLATHIKSHYPGAFFTGSCVYAKSQEPGDIDIVVNASEQELTLTLEAYYGVQPDRLETIAELSRYAPLRYGGLNVVCMPSQQNFLAWRIATLELQLRPPILDKTARVAEFKRLRDKALLR